jgi:hypothetical protein
MAKNAEGLGDTDWPVPSEGDLSKFEKYRNLALENSEKIDFTNAIYIAGRDKSTPSGYELDENGALVFLSTGAGDQRCDLGNQEYRKRWLTIIRLLC